MANSTIPGLVAVSVPALTDLLGVRQSGDSRDKKLTVSQLLSLSPSGGDVSKVGTPADSQIGVWTGDGTIEGTSAMTFDGTVFNVVTSNEMRLTGDFRLLTGSGQAPVLLDVLADETTPTICPANADRNTGIGWKSADRLAFIAGGKRAMVLAESNSIGVIPAYDTGTGLTAFAGGGQASAITLDRGYNVVTTVATTADSVKLPDGLAFLVGSVVYLKNNGANSLDLFPASGDDLGAGVDTAISLPAGASVAFIGTVEGSTWTQLIFAAGGGGGDVFKVGTPANNQLGVWTGDGTIEGDTSWQVVGSALQGVLGSGPEMRNVAGVNIHPRKGDTDTGLASRGDNRLAMVAQGIDGIKLIGASSAILQQHNTTVGLTAFAGGGAGSATQLNSSYSVIDTVATTGDSVKFSTTLEVGVVNYVKNDGANAMDLFPAAGDDLGQGVGVAISVPAGASVAFIGTVTGSVSTQFIFAGGGDVFKVGTPADNQIGVWTGDGTIEGDANFLLTGTQLILPSGSSAGLPELKIGSGQTGFFASSATQLRITVNGTERFTVTNDIIQGFLAGSGQLHNRVTSATVPTFTPSTNDGNTGIGLAANDQLSLIAGGVEVLRATEAAGVVQALVPAGIEASPSYSFINDPDTGFINETNVIVAVTGASRRVAFSSAGITSVTAGNFAIRNEVPSGTNPVLTPSGTDADTGIGTAAADQLSLIAGGVEMLRASEAAADQILIIAGTAAAPALSFFADPDSGLYSAVPGIVAMSVDGTDRFRWVGDQFRGAMGGSPSIQNEVASATNPTLLPSQTDLDTGIGRTGTDQLALVAGGLDCMTVRETGSARQIGFYVTAPISLQTGVAVTDVAIHAALVALGLITA